MKITELTGVKKYHQLTADEIMRIMQRKYGYKLLGQGSFGYVLMGKDPDIVFKIFSEDTAYLKYIDMVSKYPNEHYPRMKKSVRTMHSFHTRQIDEPDQFVVATIERLYPMDKKIGQFVVDLCSDVSKYNSFENIRYEYPLVLPTGRTNLIYNDETGNMDPRYNYDELSKQYPWIESLAYAYLTILKKVNHGADLALDNFMQRSDGTIVITDPVANVKDVERKYNRKSQNSLTKSGPVYKKS